MNLPLTPETAADGDNIISVKMSLSATISEKSMDMYTAHCPALNLESQGSSHYEAEQNITDAARNLVATCLERNNLREMLEDRGFYPLYHNTGGAPAHATGADPGDIYARQISISVELPVMAY
ncbi:MAG: hypothetical protein OD817_02505 [Gammaproteobacteria bacterium]